VEDRSHAARRLGASHELGDAHQRLSASHPHASSTSPQILRGLITPRTLEDVVAGIGRGREGRGGKAREWSGIEDALQETDEGRNARCQPGKCFQPEHGGFNGRNGYKVEVVEPAPPAHTHAHTKERSLCGARAVLSGCGWDSLVQGAWKSIYMHSDVEKCRRVLRGWSKEVRFCACMSVCVCAYLCLCLCMRACVHAWCAQKRVVCRHHVVTSYLQMASKAQTESENGNLCMAGAPADEDGLPPVLPPLPAPAQAQKASLQASAAPSSQAPDPP
jgi:hypothetical protein